MYSIHEFLAYRNIYLVNEADEKEELSAKLLCLQCGTEYFLEDSWRCPNGCHKEEAEEKAAVGPPTPAAPFPVR